MESHNIALCWLINLHKRVSLDSLITPYKIWCDWIHRSSYSPQEKMDRILSWKINPADYSNPSIFRSDWQLLKLLSKASTGGRPSELDIRVAKEKFLSSEKRCKAVNELLTRRTWSSGLEKLIPEVQKIVASVLGPREEFFKWLDTATPDYRAVHDRFARKYGFYMDIAATNSGFEFGPGVSVGTSDSLKSLGEKLTFGTVTGNLLPISAILSRTCRINPASVVNGSVLTFVLKRVGEARAICYEPSMNMLIQKLIGRYIRGRLKTNLGIDLKDQSRNRGLARLGSLCDSWSTVDLSSASDLFATLFVMNTLPIDWFSLLDTCRSKNYLDDESKQWIPFEKFSTMGNGFTFELETLLFAAITRASINLWGDSPVSKLDVCCYGDDILFPKEHYNTVVQALTICGHIPNTEKSFRDGPFRESCGGDFFNGFNVTPLKIKDFDYENFKQQIVIHNGLIASHGSISDFANLYGGYSRALNFVKTRIYSRYPRLSEGPIETRFDKSSCNVISDCTGRWLWSEEPRDQRFNRELQQLRPRYILLSTELPTRKRVYDPDSCKYVQKTCEYHVSDLCAGFMAQFKMPAPVISARVEKLIRFN